MQEKFGEEYRERLEEMQIEDEAFKAAIAPFKEKKKHVVIGLNMNVMGSQAVRDDAFGGNICNPTPDFDDDVDDPQGRLL